LNNLTDKGANIEGWRTLPIIYAIILAAMGLVFFLFSENKKPASSTKSFKEMLGPLKNVRVWRFGLYYFLVFGCFVAFSQWLVPYFVNVYYLPLVTAGIFAACFSFPSGVIRALGGWMSDKWGARKVMYWVLGSSVIICLLLIVPRMDIYSPGRGIMAKGNGTVTEVTQDKIVIGNTTYKLRVRTGDHNEKFDRKLLVFPTKEAWQEPVVKEGDTVKRKQLVAKGVTRIYFQANVWIFAILVILLGSIWGIGKAAVYKHIPDYFPEEVGVVGGMVGVLGGLGGFFCPIIFGYLLEGTGLWTSCWLFMFIISGICLWWMHTVIQKMMKAKHPESMKQMEHHAVIAN
jgi:NNP family nitrate/nitrite transporter-like MFS transporter